MVIIIKKKKYEGLLSYKNDIWSLGLLLYELFSK